LEAMALRTPVIATRAGGTTEIQRDRPILFWCEPGDAGSLADAIRNFVTSPEAAAEHVRNAGDVIDRFHDIRVAVEKIDRRMKKAAGVIDA